MDCGIHVGSSDMRAEFIESDELLF